MGKGVETFINLLEHLFLVSQKKKMLVEIRHGHIIGRMERKEKIWNPLT